MELKNYQDAIQDFSNVIRINPRIAGYFDNRQNAYRAAKLYNQALNDANTAIQLAPGYAFVYRARANLLSEIGDYVKSLNDYNTAISLAPQDAGLYIERGILYYKSARLNEAVSDFSRAIDLDNSLSAAYKHRGLANKQLGNAGGAKSDLERYLALNPYDAETEEELAFLKGQPPRVSQDPLPAPNQQVAADSRNETLKLAREVSELKDQLELLKKVLAEQRAIKTTPSTAGDAGEADETIASVTTNIDNVRKSIAEKQDLIRRYSTPTKPNDQVVYPTARKASETFPKIPFYIPGTEETGEFWVEPVISDKGELYFVFKFVDLTSDVEKVRAQIMMTQPELLDAQDALLKINDWSKTAHKEKVRKNFEKTVICFPASDCPKDGEKIEGKSSTEIKFIIYENGATAARIQRNKGKFEEGYNFSVDSAMLLQGYINHVLKEAGSEFKAGKQTKKDLNELFK